MSRTPLTDAAYSRLSDLDLTTFNLIKNKLLDHDAALDFLGVPVMTTDPGDAVVVETVTSGALGVQAKLSLISCTGAQAYTLADGTHAGQTHEIECSVAASAPAGTLTLTTTYNSEPTTHVFHCVGQKITLMWMAPGWHLVSVRRAGTLAVVVGTTVLTGYDLAAVYALSVTGTVASTSGGKGIPNGNLPGEVIHITTPTAASTPSGQITVTGTTVATGAAATTLAGINATSCEATFEWGDATTGWQNIKLTTATYS